MAGIGRTTVSLRFSGRDLDPQDIDRDLGLIATKSFKRGEVAGWGRYTSKAADEGFWSHRTEDRAPGDLDGQIADLFECATSDPAVWTRLSSRFGADLSCGLFMVETNEGLSLSASTLAAISFRGLELGFDIYDPERP